MLGVPRTNSINTQLYIYAFAILIATFIQVLLPMPWLRGLDRGEERLRVVIDWRDPAVKKTFKLMLPVTLGLGLINVNALIDVFFASRYINPDLAPTAIQKAFLIYMLPQGMFSVAIATVLFPRMARLAARGDNDGFRDTVSLGIRQITFLLFPAAVFSIVLATPIVRILFQRGAWTPSQTPVTAACLAAFSIGLVFNGAMLMLNRAFFSLQSNWIPTAVALGNLFLNALLDYLFYPLGAWGIPLSTALVNVAGTIALVYLLRREMGGIDGRRTAASAARIVLAGAVAAGISFAVWKPLDEALGHNLFITQLISLGLGARRRHRRLLRLMPPAPRSRARPGARLPPQPARRAVARRRPRSPGASARSGIRLRRRTASPISRSMGEVGLVHPGAVRALGAHSELVLSERRRRVAEDVEVVARGPRASRPRPTAHRVDLVEEAGRPGVRVAEENAVRLLGEEVLVPVLHSRDLDELGRRPRAPVVRVALAEPRVGVPVLRVPDRAVVLGECAGERRLTGALRRRAGRCA